MTTVNDQLFQFGGVPVGVPISQGKAIFVKPYTGDDANDGLSPKTPVKTLYQAHELATEYANDTIFFLSEHSSYVYTSDFLTTTLTLSKSGVRYIGVNSGCNLSQRSRISWASTATSASDIPLITFSGNNCYVEGFEFICESGDANLAFNFNLTGQRNKFVNCHFAGMAADICDVAGAYSLSLNGAAENVFEDCVIGLDTIARGTAANYELYLVSGATRNWFKRCTFLTYAEAATHLFIKKTATGLDRWCRFTDCAFINSGAFSGGSTMTEAIDYAASTSPGGCIILDGACYMIGCTDWEAATVSGEVMAACNAATVGNVTGLSVAVAAS